MVTIWRQSEPSGFETYQSLKNWLESNKPPRSMPLYAKNFADNPTRLISEWAWVPDDHDDWYGAGHINPTRPIDFRRSNNGSEFVLGSGGDLYLRNDSGSLSWSDGNGPVVEDDDLILDLGIETTGDIPTLLGVGALVDYEITADVPAKGDGVCIGWLNKAAGTYASGGGCVYSTSVPGWCQGIFYEYAALAVQVVAVNPALSRDDAYLCAHVEPYADRGTIYLTGQVSHGSETGVAPYRFGNMSAAYRGEPAGKALIRAISGGGSGATAVTVKTLDFVWVK